jgi:hypothetical protein
MGLNTKPENRNGEIVILGGGGGGGGYVNMPVPRPTWDWMDCTESTI